MSEGSNEEMREMRVQNRLRELVAEEVRALLGRRQMSGAKLATAIDRSEMYVSRRLRGETAFDLDDLERIAGVLGVQVADLLPKREGADTLT
ncbi:helix-turn-helix transcriptional regulator [Micromonospora sp. WMMD1102]|uniref:helix-turn-helix domain-containing protein n=1 Tax=Micromonospora sp. WMMD1102 TaxID=3016105 RepID=UPI002414E358|nr:helix-turn-helix transcriptional regulator [Micromonospora sp. WMMD1102]MDG4791880.1 helix-turn-helix transcriptional regulator [Micromonospora sp. WMMD1102]